MMSINMSIFRLFIVLPLLALFTGCNDSDTGNDNNDEETEPVIIALPSGDWYQPAVSVSWQWQLTGQVETGYGVDIYDIDLFDSSAALITQLQLSDQKVICYFSAGSYESWRQDSQQFNGADLGNTLDGWEDERWLDIRSTQIREIMQARLELAKTKGCDGVEPDNIDGYNQDTGFDISAEQQLDFNRFIANQAHSRNLAVGLKNDLDQVVALVDYFDFAVNEQCFEYDECQTLMIFIHQGKPVLNAEYQQVYIDDATARDELCRLSLTRSFSTLILPLVLDDSLRFSCI